MTDHSYSQQKSGKTGGVFSGGGHGGLGEEALGMVAARFRALSEASRLRLIVALEGGERAVSELVGETGMTQANVSRQLQVLTEAGILARRKDGLRVIYRIADPGIFDMCDLVCGSLRRRLEGQAGVFAAGPRGGQRRSSPTRT